MAGTPRRVPAFPASEHSPRGAQGVPPSCSAWAACDHSACVRHNYFALVAGPKSSLITGVVPTELCTLKCGYTFLLDRRMPSGYP